MGLRSSLGRVSTAQMTVLAGVTAGIAAALYWALRRNRQQWLEDTGNIDRRWDRPDRLANTQQEIERWNGHGERGEKRSGRRQDGTTASVTRERPIAADIYGTSGTEPLGDERQP